MMENASKWINIPILFDPSEWESFHQALGPFTALNVSSLCERGEHRRSFAAFIETMQLYKERLLAGEFAMSSFRLPLTLTLTRLDEGYDLQEFDDGRVLARPRFPMVQLTPASWFVTGEYQVKIGAFSKNAVPWGVQISYPQLFRHPDHYQVTNALTELDNGPFFKEIMRWVRRHSSPVAIEYGDKKFRTTLRVGTGAKQWAGQLPALQEQEVKLAL